MGSHHGDIGILARAEFRIAIARLGIDDGRTGRRGRGRVSRIGRGIANNRSLHAPNKHRQGIRGRSGIARRGIMGHGPGLHGRTGAREGGRRETSVGGQSDSRRISLIGAGRRGGFTGGEGSVESEERVGQGEGFEVALCLRGKYPSQEQR